ncbi:MAG: VOC family protein [Acidimicrobiales bacterium]
MTTRDHAPAGSPCWADLFTSDVAGSRRFYAGLFGWQANEPQAEFGGYFTFSRHGVPVSGAMGDMGDVKATDSWQIYLAAGDVAKTVEAAEAGGARVISPAMAVADLGTQAILVDPTGAQVGAWQADTFAGFTTLGEHGAPSWFELHTRDYARAIAFYPSVFGLDTATLSDSDDFRYTTLCPPGGGEVAGIMDAGGFMPEGAASHWEVYWEVDDVDTSVATLESLGGSVVVPAEDTPYGRIAKVADPAGAHFRLRSGPSSS